MKIRSSKPRKQRKFLYKAPLHIRRKMLSGHLSKELRQKYNRRSMPLRKGDEVEVMRGQYTKKRGKISKVNYKKYKVYIEGITRKTTVGTEKLVAFHSSNLKIVDLNLSDKKRMKVIDRKVKIIGKTEKTASA